MRPGTATRRPGTVTARTFRAAVQRGLREQEGRRFTVDLREPVQSFTFPGGAAGLRARFTAVLPDGSFARGLAVWTQHGVGRPTAGSLAVYPER